MDDKCNPLERYTEFCTDYYKPSCKKSCGYAKERSKREKDWTRTTNPKTNAEQKITKKP